ncbi:hypothetical protein CTI12_AA199760 [Artemisia annua]|uniref:Uncharacterized protein n=1 Tax=Artemisia annua TaxID=35608 RepID=A0A2U1P3E8_ARTAN|nr:hypothetical protein CTI12_AA199760 [Artemisia annua]
MYYELGPDDPPYTAKFYDCHGAEEPEAPGCTTNLHISYSDARKTVESMMLRYKQKGQNPNHNDGDREKKDKGKDGKNIGLSYPNVPPGLVYAPQMFSDENPNACSIM